MLISPESATHVLELLGFNEDNFTKVQWDDMIDLIETYKDDAKELLESKLKEIEDDVTETKHQFREINRSKDKSDIHLDVRNLTQRLCRTFTY